MLTTRRMVEVVKRLYQTGARVRLVKMDDIQAPPVGTMGTVDCVDDIGTIHIRWDNGSCLGAVYGEDIIKVV